MLATGILISHSREAGQRERRGGAARIFHPLRQKGPQKAASWLLGRRGSLWWQSERALMRIPLCTRFRKRRSAD